jgi:NTP pyrophosphatase (non-canonical NTP hydrolase)
MEMMVEECAELIQAFQKFKRVDPKNELLTEGAIEHICEEIADVEILIGQMRAIFGDKRIDFHSNHKMERLEMRIVDFKSENII